MGADCYVAEERGGVEEKEKHTNALRDSSIAMSETISIYIVSFFTMFLLGIRKPLYISFFVVKYTLNIKFTILNICKCQFKYISLLCNHTTIRL